MSRSRRKTTRRDARSNKPLAIVHLAAISQPTMSEQPQPPQQEAAASTSTQEALAQPESTGLGSTGQDQGGQNEDSANPDIAAVRAQVEREHALADVQKRLKELEGELERLKSEKKEVEDEKNGAGTSEDCEREGS